MVRAGLMLIALLSATSVAKAAEMSSGESVISSDNDAGHRLVITRDDSGGDRMWQDGQRQVLEYRDAAGGRVRVFADHPVTRAEVEARLASARQEADQAQAEGRRAAEQSRREVEAARAEAWHARAEGLNEAAEGRREAAATRREAERARDEAAQVIAEAR